MSNPLFAATGGALLTAASYVGRVAGAVVPYRTLGLAAGYSGRLFPSVSRVTTPIIGKIVDSPFVIQNFSKFVETSLKVSHPQVYQQIMGIVGKHGGQFTSAAVREIFSDPKILTALSYQSKLGLAFEIGGYGVLPFFFDGDDTFIVRLCEVFGITASEDFTKDRKDGKTPLHIYTKYMSDEATKGGKEPLSNNELKMIINYILGADDDYLVDHLMKYHSSLSISKDEWYKSLSSVRGIIISDPELKKLIDKGQKDVAKEKTTSFVREIINSFTGKTAVPPAQQVTPVEAFREITKIDSSGNTNLSAINLSDLPYTEVLTVKERFETFARTLSLSKAQAIEFLENWNSVNKYTPQQYAKLYGFKHE